MVKCSCEVQQLIFFSFPPDWALVVPHTAANWIALTPQLQAAYSNSKFLFNPLTNHSQTSNVWKPAHSNSNP